LKLITGPIFQSITLTWNGFVRAVTIAPIVWTSLVRLLFANYRELVHPDQAERYFNLYPATPAANVIAMA
jgi:hypothetical protein